MSRKGRKKRPLETSPKRAYVDMDLGEVETILAQALDGPISRDDHTKLKMLVETFVLLTEELKNRGTSIDRLRTLLFGPKTEKTKDVLGDWTGKKGDKTNGEAEGGKTKKRAKRRGHGRNGAESYTGAEKVPVPHPTLKDRDKCPECERGRIYAASKPSPVVRITGVAPLSAKVYEKEKLRCNACGEVFTAPSPEGVGEEKYDEGAKVVVGLLKYGAGMPFNRIEKLQKGMGIPMPASTQWELVESAAKAFEPVWQELIRQSAQGEVVHNDDTNAKILELIKERQAEAAAERKPDERTGTFTTGVISTSDDRRIALFFTGPKHAGENLADVLAQREADLPPPIQMCDGLSRNTSGDFKTILANCTAHSRRKYVEVAGGFPEECRFVLETFREVYKHDAGARKKGLSPRERLKLHQEKSGSLMKDLEKWMKEQIDERKVEPNSGLGKAIEYMQKRWKELTLFLREPGAPLDNNINERALKKAILHRKNALFFKTQNGARVGDMWMSFIHTAELNDEGPYEYLIALLRHPNEAARTPGEWMPWSYRAALAKLEKGGAAPAPPS